MRKATTSIKGHNMWFIDKELLKKGFSMEEINADDTVKAKNIMEEELADKYMDACLDSGVGL